MSATSDLFSEVLPKPPLTGKGLSKDVELLWFKRLEMADKMRKGTKDVELWQKRFDHCRNYIVASNIALAQSFAIKFANMSTANTSVQDSLLSDASTALIRAAEKFKLRHKVRFSTFAYTVIRREVTRRVMKEWERSKRFHSASDSLSARGDNRHMEEIETNDQVAALKMAMDKAPLSQAMKSILAMRFWSEMTLEQIGDVMKLSKERIRQIQAKALTKLREYMEIDDE